MSTLIITEKLLQKTFYLWQTNRANFARFIISNETKNLNDLQSGIASDKVFIYDLIKKTWLTKPQSKAQLLKFLIESM
jgi:hypothetical protein